MAVATTIDGSERLIAIQGHTKVQLNRTELAALLASTAALPGLPAGYAVITALDGRERFYGVQGGQPINFTAAQVNAILAGTAPIPPDDSPGKEGPITGRELLVGISGHSVAAFNRVQVAAIGVTSGGTAPGYAPALKFNDARNSQYLSLAA